jgi:AcrR family transcriptional regulator
MAGHTSYEQQEPQRSRLQKGLMNLCSEIGYDRVDLQMLLNRSGVKEAEFRREFADLDDCFYQFYREKVEEFKERLLRALQAAEGWRARLRASAYTLFEYLAEDRRRAYFVTVAIRSADERSLRLMSEMLEEQFDLIDEGSRERSGPNSISRSTAEAIGGAAFNQIYQLVAGPGTEADAAETIPATLYAATLPYLGEEMALEELRAPPPQLP